MLHAITARNGLYSPCSGFTLIELLVALAIAAVLIAGLGGVMGQVAATQDAVQGKNELTRQARFAMDQMVQDE